VESFVARGSRVTPFGATAVTHAGAICSSCPLSKTKRKFESRTAQIPRRELDCTTLEGRARSSTTNGIPRVMEVPMEACLT
jgi:hypothetical protein